VDDVLTTGGTATEAAHELRAAGAREVELWVVARA
jgi:predicted amidophosphoribosyltransferase